MYAHKKVTMGKINTINRLLRYLKGELSAEEAREIEKWADESKENEKELVALAKVYHLGHLARNYSKKEVDEAWAKVSGRAGGAKKLPLWKLSRSGTGLCEQLQ
jgi:anti-sigma factor RsiW